MAGDKWVSNAGVDGPAVPGTEARPFRTIQYGVDVLKGLGGGTLHVKVGFYNENVKMRGAGYSNITILGYGPPPTVEAPSSETPCGAKPTVDGSTATTNHRVFDIADCTKVALQNLTIQNGSEVHIGADLNGGGVQAENAQVDLLDCCILNNHAGNGGGFAYIQCKTGLRSKVDNCLVRGNDAVKDGGGGFIHDTKDMIISKTIFQENTIADGYGGGGLCVRHGSTITIGDKCEFTENKAGTKSSPVHACNGGGIYFDECNDTPMTIFVGKENTFTKNTSKGRGGAIHMLNHNYVEINKNTFTGNVSQNSGGAIGCVQVTGILSAVDVTKEKAAGRYVTITENTFTGNRTDTTDSGGGAIYASATSYVVLDHNTIERNASKFNGGGMHITYNSFLEAAGHNTFRENTAENNGGGLSARNSHVTLSDENRFIANEAKHNGGGVYVHTMDEGWQYHSYLATGGFKKAIVTIEHLNRFADNKAFAGAGLNCEATRAVVPMAVTIRHRNTFTGNATRDGGSGGGFYLGFLDELDVLKQNKIADNTAPDFHGFGQGGGGLILSCFAAKVDANEIINNTAGNGPGIKLRHCGGFTLTNNTLTGNRELAAGGKVINVYFNGCNMGAQTAATVAAANPPLAVAEILIYP